MSERQVVTELTIDSSGAQRGSQEYTAAMERARAAADNATGSFAQNVAMIAAMGTAMVGGAALASKLMDEVRSLNKGLADMATQAKNVGLSLADLQGVKLGGMISGLSETDINAGLQRSAQLLNDASRNSNTLSKELAENGVAIRNANGQLISQNQLLGIAADLIKRARNPGDQNAIAEMLGFTRAWIPLLEQGATAMSGLTAEAQRAGAVISDETINRATEFDRQWRKSSVEFSAYMKSAMLELLPILDDLIDRAAQFIKGIDVKAIEKAANDSLKEAQESIGLPNEAAIRIEMPQSTIDNWNKLGAEVTEVFESVRKFAADPSYMDMLGMLYTVATSSGNIGAMVAGVSGKVKGLMPSVSMVPEQDVKWYAGTSPVMDTSDPAIQSARNAATWVAEGNAWKKLSADVMSGAEGMSGGFSKVARSGSETKGAFDRAEEALLKYIEVTKAAATSIDMTTATQERFKAIAQLTAAGLKDGLTPQAAAAKAEMSGLADKAAAAAGELAKARVQSQIKFGRETAFLSQDDVAIAQQLKGLYPDVATALESVEAAQLRVNDAMRNARDNSSDFAKSFVADLRSGKSAADALGNALDNLSTKFINKSIEVGINALFSAGGGSSFLSLFGIGKADGGSVTGPGTGTSDSIPAMLSNGEFVVRASTVSMPGVREHLEMLNSGIPRYSDGGYVASSNVTPMRSAANANTSPTKIEIVNQGTPSRIVEAQEVEDGRGGRSMRLVLDDAVAASLSQPGSAGRRAMSSNFGARPQTVRRG